MKTYALTKRTTRLAQYLKRARGKQAMSHFETFEKGKLIKVDKNIEAKTNLFFPITLTEDHSLIETGTNLMQCIRYNKK